MADFDLAINFNLRIVLVTTEAAIRNRRAPGVAALLYTASTSSLSDEASFASGPALPVDGGATD